jgi:hypothetical protein
LGVAVRRFDGVDRLCSFAYSNPLATNTIVDCYTASYADGFAHFYIFSNSIMDGFPFANPANRHAYSANGDIDPNKHGYANGNHHPHTFAGVARTVGRAALDQRPGF